MRRVIHLWLALLAAYWLTRAGTALLLFERVDQGRAALVELLAIPALQALALAWLTRTRRSAAPALRARRRSGRRPDARSPRHLRDGAPPWRGRPAAVTAMTPLASQQPPISAISPTPPAPAAPAAPSAGSAISEEPALHGEEPALP